MPAGSGSGGQPAADRGRVSADRSSWYADFTFGAGARNHAVTDSLQFRRKPAAAGERRPGMIGLGRVGQGFMQQTASLTQRATAGLALQAKRQLDEGHRRAQRGEGTDCTRPFTLPLLCPDRISLVDALRWLTGEEEEGDAPYLVVNPSRAGSGRRSWRLQPAEFVVFGNLPQDFRVARPFEQSRRPLGQGLLRSMVMRTVSFSFSGSGWAGLSTPFS